MAAKRISNASTSKRYPKQVRLLSSDEFNRVHQQGVFAADATLVVSAVRNNQTNSRLGLSVGRAIGNAVIRNQWKRVIREAFRQHRVRLPDRLDLVVRPRKGADYQYSAVVSSLVRLAWRLDRKLPTLDENTG